MVEGNVNPAVKTSPKCVGSFDSLSPFLSLHLAAMVKLAARFADDPEFVNEILGHPNCFSSAAINSINYSVSISIILVK